MTLWLCFFFKSIPFKDICQNIYLCIKNTYDLLQNTLGNWGNRIQMKQFDHALTVLKAEWFKFIGAHYTSLYLTFSITNGFKAMLDLETIL